MFSSRTSWDLQPSPLFTLLREKRARGEQIIDLTESNPTHCGFAYEAHSILAPLSTEHSLTYDPDPKGLLSARRAVAEFYREQGRMVEPEHVFLMSSTSEAYSYLFRLLCNERDAILLPKPSYPLFDYLCRLNDVTAGHYHLNYDGQWHIGTSTLEQSFSGDTRAVVIVHPNNPTGSFIKLQEKEALSALALGHGAALIVDEVFGSFSFEADPLRAPSYAGEDKALTFTLNGVSKLLGLPQMKLAWIVVSGPPAVRDEAISRLEMISDIFLSVGTPIQLALKSLLRDLKPMTEQIRERVRGNYYAIRNRVQQDSGVSLHDCEGGWNATVRLPATRTDEEWALELLRSCNVLVHPGHLFDFEQRSCLVVSLLPTFEVVLEGIGRILEAVKLERKAGSNAQAS